MRPRVDHGPPLRGAVTLEVADLPSVASAIDLAADALEPELGGPLRPGGPARWRVALGGSVPAHRVDRRANVLVTEAPTVDGLFDALSTLRELRRRADGVHPVVDCADVEELIARVHEAVADSWPAAAARGVDWEALTARHAPRVRRAADPVEAAARWVAELADAHTAVRPTVPLGRLRYGVRVDGDRAVLWVVPSGSEAHRAGVRPGWRLVGTDPAAAFARTGATPHSRAWVAGSALLAGPVGVARRWEAVGPAGQRAAWVEAPLAGFDPPHIELRTLPSGARYLRIGAWAPAAREALDQAFAGPLARVDRLVVDLRGNGGGNLALAYALRDRFVREAGPVGTLRVTLPGGELGPPIPLVAAPSPTPWRGERARFLTDARTYSASEDALLGLQGQPHVEVLGRASGGGSGRMRRVRLLPGWALTVSTALTWDRRQHRIEGHGIPVDRALPWDRPTDPDPIDLALDAGW